VLPKINNLPTTNLEFTENGTAILLNQQVSIMDFSLNALSTGAGNYTGASISLSRATGANTQDIFSFNSMQNVSIVGNTFKAGGQIIATFSNSNGTLLITFAYNGVTPTTALVNEIMQAIKYRNDSNDPPASVQLKYTFNDGLGLGIYSTTSETVTIDIHQLNNAPINTVPSGMQSVNQNTELTFSSSNGKLIKIDDVDNAGASLTVTLTPTYGTLTLGNTAGLQVTENQDTHVISLTGKLVNLNNALNGLTFTPTPNYVGNKANILIVTNDNNNTGAGGSLIDQDNIQITVNPVAIIPKVMYATPNTVAIFTEEGKPVYLNNNGNFKIESSALSILNNGGDYSNTSLTIKNVLGANPQDVFSFGSMNNIEVVGNTLV
jgi:hypothetical protein